MKKHAVWVLLSLVFVWPASGLQSDEPKARSPVEPQYDENGDLKRPTDFRTWVFVGANIGLAYKQDAKVTTAREKERHKNSDIGDFHNVYISPDAYRHYVETGKFPDPTVLVMDVYAAEAREPQHIVSKGFFPGKGKGVEVAVKNSMRPDKSATDWAYYAFGPADKTAKAFPDNACYACHLKHADDDNVWVQFYPTLRPYTKAKE